MRIHNLYQHRSKPLRGKFTVMGQKKLSRRDLEKGFTLVEIMVVVVIISIMALFAAPELINYGPNMRVKAAARDLHTNLQRMKIDAIKRNRDVVMDISTVTCVDNDEGGGYQIHVDNDDGGVEEWLTFADDNDDDGSPDTYYNMPKSTALCAESFTGSSMGFGSRGLVLGNNAGKFTVKNNRNRTYTITVNVSGGISIEKTP